MKFKVLLYAPMHRKGTELLEQKCDLIYPKSREEKDLIDQVSDVDAIIFRGSGSLTKAIIESAPRLKVIGKHGVGLNAIDLETARKRGIKVVNTPTANFESVAEHFIVLALILAKKVRPMMKALEEGQWREGNRIIGTDLHGKTLGIMGFGRVGQRIGYICHRGFDMEVFYYDRVNYPEAEKGLKAKRIDKEELFSKSDFISINLPLLPETRHLVNADLLKLMKPTSFLINLARGPVWKEEDVVRFLRDKRIAGVGSDVYEVEPAVPDHPLFKLDNFVGTPHSAAHTDDSQAKSSMVASDVLAILEGREPQFPVF